MGNNKNPNQIQPGEKEPGKFHYNPGNMSGKVSGTRKTEQKSSPTLPKSNKTSPSKADE